VFSDAHRFWVTPATRHGRTGLASAPTPTGVAWEGAEAQTERDRGVVRLAPSRAAFSGRVAERVAEAVAAIGGYALDELSPQARLYEDLGFDSVTVMELKKDLEKALPEIGEVSVPELLPALGSLGELVGFYEQRSTAAVAAS
jgi:hypothetical protein